MVNLSKRTPPLIGKLSELLVSGHRARFLDMGPSPQARLELKTQSPRGLKSYDLGVVGLGIVAALEKTGDHNVLAKYTSIACPVPNRSNPIPVVDNVPPKKGCDYRGFDDDDDYTYVTCHGANDKSYTKVYYDGGEIGRANKKTSHQKRNDFGGCNNMGIFNITSTSCREEFCLYPTSDFLSSCHLCKKKLHGKDIYMYRGEKAFCSSECRSSQILMDERKEQCRSEASRALTDHVSSSPYSRGQIFSTGIVAI